MDRYELRRLDYSLSEDHLAIQEAYKQFFKTHCPRITGEVRVAYDVTVKMLPCRKSPPRWLSGSSATRRNRLP